MIHPKRILKLNTYEYQSGPIVYWMNRDMRLQDNWALVYAQELSKKHKAPLVVVYNLVTGFLGGHNRQLAFKYHGLLELEQSMSEQGIAFAVVTDEKGVHSTNQLLDFFSDIKAGIIVTDFSPLRISRKWVESLGKKITIPLYEVDAHNIVPCWVASPKQEFGAYTLRPKLQKLAPEFLDIFPRVHKQKHSMTVPKKYTQWKSDGKKILADTPIGTITAGAAAARKQMIHFFKKGLNDYDTKRNDPNADAQSGLSPYLHYGMIASQRIILDVMKYLGKKDVRSLFDHPFFEELVVRKELSDNFCYYNSRYDSPEGFPDWAQKTIREHAKDAREYHYSLKQFEQSKTHDPLWNAAQMEMVTTGKMHGYMRMYWAKKILEWTPDVATAMKIAVTLNDRYELDGRDPNGYAGIAWSIGGVHDRAWFDRPVFGKIRYMNANGCAKKFDTEAYIRRFIKN